jgi:hypothetical protein
VITRPAYRRGPTVSTLVVHGTLTAVADVAGRTAKGWPAPLARLEQVPAWTAALVGGLGIAAFAVLGTAYAEAKDGGLVPSWFRVFPVGLNGEGTLPAIFSALLLLAAGWLSFRSSEVLGSRAGRFGPLVVLGALFTFMSLDELLTIHERLEEVVHLAWWKFYAPLALVGAVAGVLVLRRIWSQPLVRAALAAGGGCWLVAQLIETQQYDGAELVHRWTILPEEVLEMTGSLLFGLAMLLVVQSAWPATRSTSL